MLDAWVAPQTIDQFIRAQVVPGLPWAQPQVARASTSLLDWSVLDRVLPQPGLDVLTVARGQTVATAAPRSAAELQALLARGISVVCRGSERHDPGLDRLARSFAPIAGEVHVQLYATPGDNNSYGWHYDFEEVFIIQTLGVKDYYFRQNTVARDTVLGDPLDFTVFASERSPLYTARLLPGDCLYLPARWWHYVKAVETSLSISVGVMPPEAFATARRIPAGWRGGPAITRSTQPARDA